MTSCIKAEISESVGLVLVFGKERIGRGTGFRVGNKYIMTCLHVVKDIIEGLYVGLENLKLTREVWGIVHKNDTPLLFAVPMPYHYPNFASECQI